MTVERPPPRRTGHAAFRLSHRPSAPADCRLGHSQGNESHASQADLHRYSQCLAQPGLCRSLCLWQPDDADGVLWGRWLLSDPLKRTLSPYSTMTVAACAEDGLKERTAEPPAVSGGTGVWECRTGNAELLRAISKVRDTVALRATLHSIRVRRSAMGECRCWALTFGNTPIISNISNTKIGGWIMSPRFSTLLMINQFSIILFESRLILGTWFCAAP